MTLGICYYQVVQRMNSSRAIALVKLLARELWFVNGERESNWNLQLQTTQTTIAGVIRSFKRTTDLGTTLLCTMLTIPLLDLSTFFRLSLF
jgi:hypothetical protein